MNKIIQKRKGKQPKRKPLSIMLLLTLLLTAIPTGAAAASVISSEAEEHILNELGRANIPNAAVAVIQNGETSYIFKDSTHDTLFQIGSVAKSFTGFGVLLLEDMGLISVSDPVNQHLPWFEVRYNGASVPHQDITIYNLLHHTSGFTSDERRFPPSFSGITADGFKEHLMGIELAFYPSANFVYGNANYIILGLIIEAVSGQSYDEFMTQHVLHPLGLYNTFTDIQSAHETGRIIGGNRLGFSRIRPQNLSADYILVPSGFIYSSVSDMARWAGIHLGTIDISEQFSRIVHRSHEYNNGLINPFTELGFHYAAGWRVDSGSIEHSGIIPGNFAIVRILEDENSAVVILGNLGISAASIAQLGDIVLDSVSNRSFDSMSVDFFAIIDIVFAVVVVICIVQVVFLIRLLSKTKKRLRNGEAISGHFAKENIKWLIDPIISIVSLMFFYVGLPIIFDNSLRVIMMVTPSSIYAAIITAWIAVVCSLLSLGIKVFVNPKN